MQRQKDASTFRDIIRVRLALRWVDKGKIDIRSLSSDLTKTLSRLEQFRLLIQVSFKVRLAPVVAGWSLSKVKEFCEGILDPSSPHDWRSSLLQQHASRHARASVAASLFLFRKIVPKPMSMEEKCTWILRYTDKMTSPSPPLDVKFDAFCRRKMKGIFKDGWDKRWTCWVDNFTLPTSSCLERNRKSGGSRGGDRVGLRDEYRRFCAGDGLKLGVKTVPMVIWTGGKWRLVTKFSERRSFLTPLHRLIYSHLSKKKWLLRGEATRDSFKDFKKKEGEVFVSGDYESATDNLNLNMTKLIVDCLRESSRHVPHPVWQEAQDNLENQFPDGRMQSRGQLMGALLSFPLLCIANYLTFLYAIPRYGVPVKINGDDIVFRCTPKEKDSWFSRVGESGLVCSKGKTLVLSSAFSLNSSFFISKRDGNVVDSHVVRSTCLFGGVEEPNQIAGRLKGVYRGGGVVGDQVRSFALKEMSKQVWLSNRSVRRGLGAQVSWRALKWSGLINREVFYNELPKETPLPPRKKQWSQNAIPDGYRRVRRHGAEAADHPDFVKDMIECCWIREPIVGDDNSLDRYWEIVRENTFRYVPPCEKRFARMAGMTEREIDNYYNRRTNTVREIGKMVWVKTQGAMLPFPAPVGM